jgi:uncharacterized protein
VHRSHSGKTWDVSNQVEPPAAVLVDKRLVVGESRIEGRGLLFAEAVPTGTVVIRLGGRLVSSAELDALISAADADSGAPYIDTITVFDDAHLVLPPNTLAHFANHSCDPTLWYVDAFQLATRRDVNVGDEATLDYGTISGAEGFRMTCHCSTADCRGEVTSADWTRPELQGRYHDHFVPALRKRFQPCCPTRSIGWRPFLR